MPGPTTNQAMSGRTIIRFTMAPRCLGGVPRPVGVDDIDSFDPDVVGPNDDIDGRAVFRVVENELDGPVVVGASKLNDESRGAVVSDGDVGGTVSFIGRSRWRWRAGSVGRSMAGDGPTWDCDSSATTRGTSPLRCWRGVE